MTGTFLKRVLTLGLSVSEVFELALAGCTSSLIHLCKVWVVLGHLFKSKVGQTQEQEEGAQLHPKANAKKG